MAVYMIFLREGAIVDPAAMEEYRNANRDTPGNFKLEPLVVYGKMETLEGDAPDGIVMLKFPTAEDAKAWYFSPGYQAAMQHRKRAADYRAILVEGV